MNESSINLISTISATLKSLDNKLNHLNNNPVFYSDPQWIAIFVALLLGVTGIFQDSIRKLFRKPKLKVTIELSPPDCHKIALRNSENGQYICDTYYLRYKITNDGNYPLEEIEVLASELYKNNNHRYTKMNNFLPINLKWAHNHVVTMKKIQPKLFKHCDFGHILQGNQVLGKKILEYYGFDSSTNVFMQLDTFVEPNTGSHILLPGKYKIKLIFSANNLAPYEVWYKLNIKNQWTDNETDMLTTNIDITRIYS